MQTRRLLYQQQGQVLVLGLMLATLGALALVRYFGVGQAVADKTRLVHTADTAAYSGALVQARVLNMLALLNRTQLAHQIAMAHLLTLGTWAMLGGTQATKAAGGNPPFYLIGMLFGADHGQAYAASFAAAGLETWAREGTGPLAQAFSTHESLVHDLLSAVQEDLISGLPEARRAAITQIVSHQYGDTHTAIEVSDDGWPGYLQGIPRQQLVPAIRTLANRHAFLAPRNDTQRNTWMVQVRCPARRHELRRRGRTVLSDTGVWESIDTQSYHALRANRWIGCYYREYEMGWGWIPSEKGETLSEPHVEAPPDDFSLQDFWRWVQSHTDWGLMSDKANPLANSRAYAARARWPSRGLPVLHDVGQSAAQAVGFRLRLLRQGKDGRQYLAQSFAESYFRRPAPRQDNQLEHAHAFRPYWLARLAEGVSLDSSRGRP